MLREMTVVTAVNDRVYKLTKGSATFLMKLKVLGSCDRAS